MIDRINEIENKRFHACQMYDYWMKQSCKKSANLWQKIAREYKTELDQLYAELEAATK